MNILNTINSVSVLSLTNFEAKDLVEEIVRLYKQCWVFTYANRIYNVSKKDIIEHLSNENEVKEFWLNILGSTNRKCWIAKDKKKIIGFCIAKKEKDNNELEYIYIYILPEFQSKGIGKRFMNFALDWLGGEKSIILFGARNNINAINFYKKFGFVLSTENIPPKVLKGGKKIETIKMIRTN